MPYGANCTVVKEIYKTNWTFKAAFKCQISGRDRRNLDMWVIPFSLDLSWSPSEEFDFAFGFKVSRHSIRWNGEQGAFWGEMFKDVLAIMSTPYVWREEHI